MKTICTVCENIQEVKNHTDSLDGSHPLHYVTCQKCMMEGTTAIRSRDDRHRNRDLRVLIQLTKCERLLSDEHYNSETLRPIIALTKELREEYSVKRVRVKDGHIEYLFGD